VNVSHNLGIATKVAKLIPIGVIKGWVKKIPNLKD
jgi:RNA-splicing ligase RtcB